MQKSSFQNNVQSFGRFLSGMVMPNIGAFIAWGLITAFFIPTGWIPNEGLASLVGPMITYLLPLLIAFSGGRLVAGIRGGVIGAVATMGVIVGSDIPMFIGAMVMGPFGGWTIKKVDQLFEGKIKSGFEMLVNNFSAGIVGGLLAILAYQIIGPIVGGLNEVLRLGVNAFVSRGLLPLASIFIEPAKILFLNNAINHGVLGPLGIQEAAETGKSIFFMLETNPGPGLGILLAYWIFAKGMVKQSAPGAIIIHFFGGIHEIYFPYVLMKPSLLLAVIGGGAGGIFTFRLFSTGLVATPSPGSIFAYLAMTPRGNYLGVFAGILVATAVSFLIASALIKRSVARGDTMEFESAQSKVREQKGKELHLDKKTKEMTAAEVDKIVFACDAGMGSSAMGAGRLRKKIEAAGLDITVVNKAVNEIPEDAQIVITHQNLTERAKNKAPHAEHISIQDFLQTPVYDQLVNRLSAEADNSAKANNRKEEAAEAKTESSSAANKEILKKENIKLGLESIKRNEAIKMAGQLLVDSGYVDQDYVDAMLDREKEMTTYIGQGVAIPHGVGAAKKKINKTGISILQFPDGVDFEGETAYLVIAIAGVGNEHLKILANLSELIEEDEAAEKLRTTDDVDYIYEKFTL
ncbi:MAG: PTS system, mannitol-specific IIA component [Halanaerobium sp. 4-GBenrich]|jgi:PTS system mannitol-specific IIC component|uniref:Mannitol-specific phosphotransferase enzyme IIA component n=1 Tax=Halanaerobium congolense TaxID=54121 RepID=A0A1M7M1M1_9FIRM|nr:PTS mannitol transporter subunit IICBA [Halanaerobium congolense]KXS50229.1 MAG: PTS system, mannitol-specific IIA component [Halanaerobium sp. T82-1]ODS50886.1 MAG: PTS system, mannitol-specific IIA component [Halanaerobium sp. 4-GBenrich]OEG63430.1 MAG: PTS mannitol transporter subunit IICBA [Halanaerobium sp. MDAL1]TDP26690.1 PTS system mannitol-specific IIC component [Halanaerobium congolense]TDS32930.1 PTS system mannitol-specific IIC component [Halanaerobium congolense]